MKKLLSLFVIFLITSLSANAAIRVSPSYIELDANKTKKDYITGSFSITGGKDETVRFKVYPEFFEYDTNGKFVGLEDKGQKNSLMGKIKFFPNEFTCKDGLEQKVRFTITDVKTLPQGESRLVLFLEDAETKEVVIKKANGGIGGKILVKTRVGVPIYVDKGLFSRKGSLDRVVVKNTGDKYYCDYRIVSNGNSRVRYSGNAYLTQNNKLIKQLDLYGMTVPGGKFVETSQLLDIKNEELKAGQEYKLKLVLRYLDEKQNPKFMKKEVTFTPNQTTPCKI